MEINKYSLGKIYTIRHPDSEKYYIGSTCQKYLSRYFNKNKSHYISGWLTKTVNKLFDMGVDDCYIELLENYPCNDRNELSKREGELIRLHKNNIVNKRIEGRTPKEYYKEYCKNNNEKIKQDKKEYREVNKETLKQNRIDNKETLNEYIKEYRVANKDKLNEKHNCECGGKYTHGNISVHIKSLKHKKYIESLNTST